MDASHAGWCTGAPVTELFGFDFMLDAAYGVWLLEANSSPDMSRNAAPLRKIVDEGLADLVAVVVALKHERVPVARRRAREGESARVGADAQRKERRLGPAGLAARLDLHPDGREEVLYSFVWLTQK